MNMTRRGFLAGCVAGLAGGQLAAAAETKAELAREVGITTSSLGGHVALKPNAEQFSLFDLPGVLRESLDMRVIDLNTTTLGEAGPAELDRFRNAAEKAGCFLTNLKMNQRDLNMDSPDAAVRSHAIREYKRSIDVAARLGCRWARPLPRAEEPDWETHVAGYRELADYAGEKGVEMLVENFGWMQDDPDALPRLVAAIGSNVAASPDIGNWDSDELRFQGLEKAFPLAVTCDFKARGLTADGTHYKYDLRRCFEIGWKAGFRGPWCLEHTHPDRAILFRELSLLRNGLRVWMNEAG